MTLLKVVGEYPPVVVLAAAMLFIMGCWAIIDYNLARSDKRESDAIQRNIRKAYQNMRKDRP